jgi:FtsZ-interacting cell division protein YlmF
MKSPNSAVYSPTAVVRSNKCRAIDFRSGADHIQGRRGVDYAAGGCLVTLKATHRIGVQQAVAAK